MSKPSRAAVERAAEALVAGERAAAQMGPRELAEACFSPAEQLSVNDLEDLIRAKRGLPALDRTAAA